MPLQLTQVDDAANVLSRAVSVGKARHAIGPRGLAQHHVRHSMIETRTAFLELMHQVG